MISLVNRDGSLKYSQFIDLDSGHHYLVVASVSTYQGDNPFQDNAFLCDDTILRLEGSRLKTFSREALSKRFKNVEHLVRKDPFAFKTEKKAKAKPEPKKTNSTQYTL